MPSYHDRVYLDLIRDVLKNGKHKTDRTGTGTISVFGRQMRFDLSDGTIPLLTTKKMHIRSIVHELLWYFMGTSSVQYLRDNNVTIWEEWTNERGSVGRLYGTQWRDWRRYKRSDTTLNDWYEIQSVDQIADVINTLKTNPDSRRMIISAWNVADLDQMALPPCHLLFQFYTNLNQDGSRSLSCALTQRSCDVGLGVPFNIVQYALLTRMVAEVVGMIPGELIWSGGDVHIYTNHVDALKQQLERDPFPSPKFAFANRVSNIDAFKFEDFVISDYQSHPTIKMEVSV